MTLDSTTIKISIAYLLKLHRMIKLWPVICLFLTVTARFLP